MTTHIQIAKLEYALGGAIVMNGFPIPPLVNMIGLTPEKAKTNATCTDLDMKWMIFHGEYDIYFRADRTMELFNEIWDLLGIRDTINSSMSSR